MNATVHARRALYRYLYEQRVRSPQTYFSKADLQFLSSEEDLEAAVRFGVDMGHLERYRKHYRLTAPGMLFAEQQGWMEEA